MSGNAGLRKADGAKNDEFYTRLADIETEMRNYKKEFRGKTVLCNCDDPFESNFFKYFAMNFNHLGLKKLIAASYAGSPVANTQLKNNELHKAYKIEITEVEDYNKDGAVDLSDVEYLLKNKENSLTPLEENGDFRSEECKRLLEQADIIATNPPFSLFREYVAQLIEFKKNFIIIGNTNALTYKEIFNLFKEDKIRTGNTNFNVGMYFYVPDSYDEYHKIEDGKKTVRVSTSCWFTNLPVKKHNEKFLSYKRFDPAIYPKYDNYDAINVDKYLDIPEDYYEPMGVPITFLDKYNPEQFEIIDGIGRYSILDNERTKKEKKYLSMIDGKAKYFRLIIKRRRLTNEDRTT